MDHKTEMELQVWEGDYGLVSIDAKCLRTIAYMEISKAPFKLTPLRNGNLCKYQLPILKHHGTYVSNKFEKSVEHLRFNHHNLDIELTDKERSLANALTALLLQWLEPALEYTMWLDKRNSEELTIPWFTKLMAPIVNIFYTRKKRKEALQFLKMLCKNCDDPLMIEEYLKVGFKDCLEVLSQRLGEQKFFFGDKPCTLDCTLYAFLAPLVKIPFPSNEFPKLAQAHSNLLQLVSRIDGMYLKDLISEMEVRRRRDRLVVQTDCKDSISPGWKVGSVLCVACAMFAYAAVHKILPPKLTAAAAY